MFREKLKNDLDGISPNEELLNKVTKMMQEEAAKPRQPKHVVFMRFAGMAAAVCMVAVGAGALYGTPKMATETAAGDSAAVEEAALFDAQKSDDAENEASRSFETTAATMPVVMDTESPVDEAAEEIVTEKSAEETTAEILKEETVEYIAAEETTSVIEESVVTEETTDTEETTPAVEESPVPKTITGGEALYQGVEYSLTDGELAELDGIVSKYIAENPHRKINRALTDEETEQCRKSGLSLTLIYDDGSEVSIYADDENAYICAEDTYQLGSNVHTQIISYAEMIKIKKMFGF